MATFDPTLCADNLDCGSTIYTTEQFLRFVFTVDANGCLALRTTGAGGGGGGGGGDASAANQTTEIARLASILGQLDITQTQLANLLKGASAKDLTTLDTLLDARLGSLTETAPATDTASAGANGRLQRIAQRLTSLIGLFRLGQGTMAQSLAVTFASDQTALPVTGTFYPATQPVSIASAGTETPTASIVTGSGASPVAAGKSAVTFVTDNSFVGTILGIARNPSTTYKLAPTNPFKTLSAIAYTVTAGSMTIDVQS